MSLQTERPAATRRTAVTVTAVTIDTAVTVTAVTVVTAVTGVRTIDYNVTSFAMVSIGKQTIGSGTTIAAHCANIKDIVMTNTKEVDENFPEGIPNVEVRKIGWILTCTMGMGCLLYTSDAADE